MSRSESIVFEGDLTETPFHNYKLRLTSWHSGQAYTDIFTNPKDQNRNPTGLKVGFPTLLELLISLDSYSDNYRKVLNEPKTSRAYCMF